MRLAFEVAGRRPRGCRGRTPRPRRARTRRARGARITTPATIVGARSGCRPADGPARRERQRGEALELRLERGAREHVPLDAGRVVGLERRGRSRRTRSAVPATAIAAIGARRRPGRRRRARRRRRRRARPARRGVGGSVWRWRSVWRTTPICVETWKPIAPRAPQTSSVEPPPMSITTRSVGVVRRAHGGRAGVRVAPPPRRRSACGPRGRTARAPRRRTPRRWRRRAPPTSSRRRRLAAVRGDRRRVALQHGEHARLRVVARAGRSRRRRRRAA